MRNLSFSAISFILFSISAYGQCDPGCGPNLVPNGDFEEADPVFCDDNESSELWSDLSPVASWIGAATTTSFSNIYTPDYFNEDCAAGNPNEGVDQTAGLGFFTVSFTGFDASEWIQVQLSEPLVAGQQYCVTFSAKTYTEKGSPGDGLDVAILNDPVVQNAFVGDNPTGFTPAYSNPTGQLITEEFQDYSFTYCANGGEQWLAMGNQNATQTFIEPPGVQGYVIVDNVTLSESCNQSSIEFEVQASETVLGCEECTTLEAIESNGDLIPVDWSDGLGDGVSSVEVCPSETSTYTATIVSNSCAGDEIELTEEITIEVDCSDELAVDLTGGTICPGELFSLLAEVSGGVPPYDFQWEPQPLGNEAGPFDVSPDQTTIYTVEVTDGEGTVSVGEATVVVSEDALDLDFTSEQNLCDGPVTLDVSAGGGLEYLWSDGSTDATLLVDEAGTYTVEVSNSCATETADFLVTECETLVVTIQDAAVCPGESVELEASVSGGTPPYSFSWSSGSSTDNVNSVSPSQTTLYILVVTDANNNSAEATAEVEVVSSETSVNLGSDRFICPDDTLLLDADLGTNFQYSWNVGSASPSLEVTRGGSYSVAIETPCSVLRDTIEITEAIPELNYSTEVKACQGTEVEIGPSNSDDYAVTWADGEMTDRKLVSEEGLYSALLTSEECPGIPVEVSVELLNCDCNVYVPNAFTPNADGVNDVFKVVPDCDIDTYSLRIFNRWGNQVFSSDTPDEVWRGESLNNEYFANNSVYNYILIIQPRNELFAPEPIVLRGSITLLR